MNLWLRLALVFIVIMSAPLPSFAATGGCVRGQIRFIQHNQGYCPTTRACSSDLYRQIDYKNSAGSPLRKALVRINRLGATLATFVTDDSGNFTANWYSLDSHTAGYVQVIARQKVGLVDTFKIGQWNVNTNDAQVMHNSPSLSLTNGTTCSSPQVIPTIYIGTTTTPNELANIFDAADRMWRWSIALTSAANDVATADIEFPADSGVCPNGCFSPSTRRIGIPDVNSDALLGASRTAHELGHALASRIYVSDVPNPCQKYGLDGDNGWSLQSQEWGCAAFSEAIAQFSGDVSRYWANHSAVADTCYPSDLTVCPTMLEPSSASCSAAQQRWPLTVMQFFWDAFDQAPDGMFNEANGETFPALINGISYFAAGTGERQRDEWQGTGGGSGSSSAPFDQSGAYDFWWNYWDRNPSGGVALQPSYQGNCSPPGDR
jgi:hypothetical protein